MNEQYYVSEDGKRFETEEEAKAHGVVYRVERKIAGGVSYPGRPPRTKERDAVPEVPKPSAKQPAKRTGRPPKRERPKMELVPLALAHLHKRDADGSIGNWEPAKTEQIAKDAEVSTATVSKFFKKEFPGLGYRGYEGACRRDARKHIGTWLDQWLREKRPDHAALKDDEAEKAP